MLLSILLLLLPMAQAKTIKLRTSDGVQLSADAHVAANSTRGVLLVHQSGKSSKDWQMLTDVLNRAGFSTAAIDLRGHGQSDKAGSALVEADYLNMAKDLDAGLKWLRKQGVKDVACVGASLGANLCVRAAAEDGAFTGLVLLSPAIKYNGISSGKAIREYGERPVSIVVSSDDRKSSSQSAILKGLAKGDVRYEVLDGAGHGTEMLYRSAPLAPDIGKWLMQPYLKNPEDRQPVKTIDAGMPSAQEGKGKKLQVHQ